MYLIPQTQDVRDVIYFACYSSFGAKGGTAGTRHRKDMWTLEAHDIPDKEYYIIVDFVVN